MDSSLWYLSDSLTIRWLRLLLFVYSLTIDVINGVWWAYLVVSCLPTFSLANIMPLLKKQNDILALNETINCPEWTESKWIWADLNLITTFETTSGRLLEWQSEIIVTVMEATDDRFCELVMFDIDRIINWHSSDIFPHPFLPFFLLVNTSQRSLDCNASLVVYFSFVYLCFVLPAFELHVFEQVSMKLMIFSAKLYCVSMGLYRANNHR